MNTNESFWRRVNDALDERRDPLEDSEVQRLVLDEPGLLDELERVNRRLGRLEARRTSVLARALSLAGLIALVTVGVWNYQEEIRGTAEPTEFMPLALVDHAGASGPFGETVRPGPAAKDTIRASTDAVLAFHSIVVTQRCDGRDVQRFDGALVASSRSTLLQFPDAAGNGPLGSAARIETISYRGQ